MPNKTIYVSEGDLPLFDRAQELCGGNLSGAIAAAVREYADAAEQVIRRQYRTVTVQVGPPGGRRRQRFTAVLLAEWPQPSDAGGLVGMFSAFLTVRERYAVYRRTRDLTDGTDADDQGEAVLDVYDSLDALAAHTPPEFARLVAAEAAGFEVEDLDI